MDVFDLTATLTLDSSDYDDKLSEASSETSRFGDVLKANLASDAVKFGLKTVAKGFEAVTSFTKKAVSSYAQYEQLVGGIETLYKTSADTVMRYANDAYKTAGMSANQYMETATSFAAALTQSLGGDTAKAAEYANIAIMDMSDNANKMGTSIDSIVQTYQSLSRGNYAMLDNLKLGYGGTKAELERLLEDAERYKAAQGEIADYSIDSYSDIVEAIHVVQEEMGITGTTASEAASTIEGSLNSAKAAWENLLTGIANGDANVGELFDTFFQAVGTAASNIIPAVETALSNIANLIVTKGPELAQKGVELITHLGQGIADAIPDLIARLPEIIVGIVNFISSNLPAIVQTGVQIIVAIIKGLAQALPQLIAAAPQILEALGQGILASLQILWESGPEIIQAIGQGILNGLSALGDLGVQIVQAIAEGILSALGWLGDAIISVFNGGLDAGDQAAAQYRSLGEHAATETSDGYRDNSFSLTQAISDSLNSANAQGRQDATRASVTGEILSTSTANGVKANSGQISGATSSAVSNAISAGRAAGAGASSIGAAISNGIASGIMGAAGRIASAAVSVVTQALSAAKAAASIASPSKKFRDEVGLQMGLGVAEGLEDSEDKAVQAAKQLAEKTYSTAAEWLRRETKFQKLTLEEQIEVWQDIQSQFIATSKQWIQAEEEIFDLREKLADERAKAEEKAAKDAYDDAREQIRRRTKFEKLSIVDQIEMWDDLLKRYEANSEEYLEIDEKIFDLREDLAEDYEKRVSDTWNRIADAYNEYSDAVASRSADIASAYGLFDDVQDRYRMNGDELVTNLTRQVNVMTSFYDQLDQLAERGAGAEMVEEIRQMGPKAADHLDALVKLSDKQFRKYVELYGKKQQLANSTAIKELTKLKDQTGSEIKAQLRELDRLYDSTAPTIGESFAQNLAQGIKDGLGSVVNAATKLAEEANNAFLRKLNLSTSVGSSLGGTKSTLMSQSALGAASTTVVNTLANGVSGVGGTFNVNMNVDGQTIARATFDPLKNFAASQGQPIVVAT